MAKGRHDKGWSAHFLFLLQLEIRLTLKPSFSRNLCRSWSSALLQEDFPLAPLWGGLLCLSHGCMQRCAKLLQKKYDKGVEKSSVLEVYACSLVKHWEAS